MKLKNFFWGFLIVNGLWWLGAVLLDRPILPSPLVIYAHLPQLLNGPIMWTHIGHSLMRIFWGMSISILLGLVLGILMAQSPLANKLLNPVVYFTYPIPKIAFLPAVMVLFGLGDNSRIMMIVLIIVFQIIINVRDSVRDIPAETYAILKVLGATRWQLFHQVTLPAALSSILSSVRVALGTAMSILFITENFGTSFGIGFYILNAVNRINYIDMYSGIVILSTVGFLLFLIVDLLEAKLLKWRT